MHRRGAAAGDLKEICAQATIPRLLPRPLPPTSIPLPALSLLHNSATLPLTYTFRARVTQDRNRLTNCLVAERAESENCTLCCLGPVGP